MQQDKTRRGYTQSCFPKGFTLIELLVVVLIIGILGAIAVPQYQRAVLKSRFAALMPIAKSMADSNEAYYLEHGEYADNAEDLPIQGRRNYSDGTELEFGTLTGYSYVLATRDNDFPNNYVVYQKHSEQYPGEIHCEAASDNTQAQEVCKSFGPTQELGETLTSGYLTYVLFGTGNGEAPSGDNTENDEPDEPQGPVCEGVSCDDEGNITECASGQTLNNGSCEDCATAFPGAATCSATSYAPTACATGYVLNGTVCVTEADFAKLQARAASQCPANQTRMVCTIKNGTISKCDTDFGTINAQGECVSNGTTRGIYEYILNPDGIIKQEYYCEGMDSGHCYKGIFQDYTAGPGKYRVCADKATISKDLICANGYAQEGADYTSDSKRNHTDENLCSAVNMQGVCTAYSSMQHYDYTYNGGIYTGYVVSACASISDTTCVGNNYKNVLAYKKDSSFTRYVQCYNSAGSGTYILEDGTCPSGYSIKQRTAQNGQTTYKTCSSYNSIDWANATCS